MKQFTLRCNRVATTCKIFSTKDDVLAIAQSQKGVIVQLVTKCYNDIDWRITLVWVLEI
jgi:hypothetical protein